METSTAHDAATAALHQMRERLRALPSPASMLEEIVARAPVGLQIYDRQGRCILVNPRHAQLFGAVPPPDYNVFEDTVLIERGVAGLVRRAFDGEHIVIAPIWYDARELRNIQLDKGRRFAVGAELVPLRDEASGQVTHVLFVFQDVTEVHQAREAAEAVAAHAQFLAEAGRLLGSSLDFEATLAQVARLSTPTIADFCIVDVIGDEGRVLRVAAVHADPAHQPLLDEICRRYPPREGSPQPAMRAIQSRAPELLERVDTQVVDAHSFDAEHAGLMRQLGVRSHLAVPLLLGDRILGAISLGYTGERTYGPGDVPLAEALASRAAVAIENARLYRMAEQAREQAERASRAKDEFLAMLGHELRNPLAPIVTALELTRLQDGTRPELGIIERQVQHLRRLVDDLLDVSRIARGELELDMSTLDLAEAVNDGLELARPLISGRGHTLEIDRPAHALSVLGDRIRLAQVVANLLTNAARYTPPGGRIQVLVAAEGGQAVLRVRDNGIGMSPDLLPRVFDLFVQGRQGLERGTGGLGLGLTIVRSLVERHGGQVRASSEGLGHGSELEVRLPLHAVAGAAGTGSLARNDGSGSPDAGQPSATRLMVVDDNEDAAVLLAESLGLCGYEVLVSHDPHQAIQLALTGSPRLALIDIGLPGMDGHELARRLRQQPGLETLPLVALTGYGQEGDRARSEAAGFAAHLVKPVSLEEVLQVVQRLLA